MKIEATADPNVWVVGALVTNGYDDEPTDDGWWMEGGMEASTPLEAEDAFIEWITDLGLATHD